MPSRVQSRRVPNVVLRDLLAQAGWTPTRLVAAVNEVLGPGYVRRSTVSEWVNCGRLPRDPLPVVVAHVLAQVLGEPVTADRIWPGTGSAAWCVRADAGFPGTAATADTVVATAHDWLRHAQHHGARDARCFLHVASDDLLNALPSADAPRDHLPVTAHDCTAALSRSIAQGLQELALSANPGAGVLEATHRQVVAAAAGITDRPPVAVDAGALAGWSQVTEAAGHVARNAGRYGLAQRYWLTAAQAAGATGDLSRTRLLAAAVRR